MGYDGESADVVEADAKHDYMVGEPNHTVSVKDTTRLVHSPIDDLEIVPNRLSSSSRMVASPKSIADMIELDSTRINHDSHLDPFVGNTQSSQSLGSDYHFGEVLRNEHVATTPTREHPNAVLIQSAKTSSSISSVRSGADPFFVDLFALAPSEYASAHDQVDWVVSLNQHAEPKAGQLAVHKVASHGGGNSMPEELHRESHRLVFTWNAWEQSLEQAKRKASWTHIDSPEFTLSGDDGFFYLRYWPYWDVANDIACLRMFGPSGCQRGRYRLGIGDACYRDVEICEETLGQKASQVWFFASSETNGVSNLEKVWVAVPA